MNTLRAKRKRRCDGQRRLRRKHTDDPCEIVSAAWHLLLRRGRIFWQHSREEHQCESAFWVRG